MTVHQLFKNSLLSFLMSLCFFSFIVSAEEKSEIDSEVVTVKSDSIVVAEEKDAVVDDRVTITSELLEIEEPSMLPSSYFYFLKSWSENLSLFFTFDEIKEANKRLEYANERFIEIKKMMEDKKQKYNDVKKSLENFEKQYKEIFQIFKDYKEEDMKKEEVQDFQEYLVKSLLLREAMIAEMEDDMPEDIKGEVYQSEKMSYQGTIEILKKSISTIDKIKMLFSDTLKKFDSALKSTYKQAFSVVFNLNSVVFSKAEGIMEAFQNLTKEMYGDTLTTEYDEINLEMKDSLNKTEKDSNDIIKGVEDIVGESLEN